MKLDIDAVEKFLERHPVGPLFVFGFTFMIWQNFVETLRALGVTLDLKRAVVLHGGGWKKLQDISMDSRSFAAELEAVAGVTKVVNYYGMVEQTGSLFWSAVTPILPFSLMLSCEGIAICGRLNLASKVSYKFSRCCRQAIQDILCSLKIWVWCTGKTTVLVAGSANISM